MSSGFMGFSDITMIWEIVVGLFFGLWMAKLLGGWGSDDE
jgi:hypothetical protein